MADDGQRLLDVPIEGTGTARTVREYLADTLYTHWIDDRQIDWDAWERPLREAFARVSRDHHEHLIALAIEALKGPLDGSDPNNVIDVDWL